MKFIVYICFLQLLVCAKHIPPNEILRDKIIEDELKSSIGGNIVLTKKEEEVNSLLMRGKLKELNEGLANSRHYKLSRSYFEFKDEIKQSSVYQLLKLMPKAAALHVHINAVLGPDFFLNVTYKSYLHICQGKKVKFLFSYFTPKDECDSKWQLMSDVRKSVRNLTQFDLDLKKQFTLDGEKYENIDQVWNKFSDIFRIIYPLWSHRPVWEQYMREMIKKCLDDNVMYLEARSSIPDLYELDGTKHNEVFFINLTKSFVEFFKREHHNFLGMKMILSFNRHVEPKTIQEFLEKTKILHNMFPDFIAGFDLVGYEDGGSPLKKFSNELELSRYGSRYFFHAGETNWYGAEVDENLVDAVLLGTKRIGHGLALEKHPIILQKVKDNHIGVEVNVVSNNVLNYVRDLRNHPLALFIAQDMPVTLSSDDPGFWDAEVLTTDFYVAFVCVSSRHHDLRLLKQLALNSIEYSAMTDEEKKSAYFIFQQQWNKYIDDITKLMLKDGKHSYIELSNKRQR